MITLEEFLNENKNNKDEAVIEFTDSLKSIFSKYSLETRKQIWKALTSEKGKKLIDKIIANPKTNLSDSEFKKLV